VWVENNDKSDMRRNNNALFLFFVCVWNLQIEGGAGEKGCPFRGVSSSGLLPIANAIVLRHLAIYNSNTGILIGMF
jgi:hypothetical protein